MTEKNLDNMNRNQRQHNAESNLREQNPESREHLQCTACPLSHFEEVVNVSDEENVIF